MSSSRRPGQLGCGHICTLHHMCPCPAWIVFCSHWVCLNQVWWVAHSKPRSDPVADKSTPSSAQPRDSSFVDRRPTSGKTSLNESSSCFHCDSAIFDEGSAAQTCYDHASSMAFIQPLDFECPPPCYLEVGSLLIYLQAASRQTRLGRQHILSKAFSWTVPACLERCFLDFPVLISSSPTEKRSSLNLDSDLHLLLEVHSVR